MNLESSFNVLEMDRSASSQIPSLIFISFTSDTYYLDWDLMVPFGKGRRMDLRPKRCLYSCFTPKK